MSQVGRFQSSESIDFNEGDTHFTFYIDNNILNKNFFGQLEDFIQSSDYILDDSIKEHINEYISDEAYREPFKSFFNNLEDSDTKYYVYRLIENGNIGDFIENDNVRKCITGSDGIDEYSLSELVDEFKSNSEEYEGYENGFNEDSFEPDFYAQDIDNGENEEVLKLYESLRAIEESLQSFLYVLNDYELTPKNIEDTIKEKTINTFKNMNLGDSGYLYEINENPKYGTISVSFSKQSGEKLNNEDIQNIRDYLQKNIKDDFFNNKEVSFAINTKENKLKHELFTVDSIEKLNFIPGVTNKDLGIKNIENKVKGFGI